MKKVLLTALMGSLTVAAFGQGLIAVGNGSTTDFYTNSVGIGGGSAATPTAANGGAFYYEVLTAPSTVTSLTGFDVAGALAGGWSDTSVTATNSGLAGRMNSTGGSAVGALDWPAATYQSFAILGWSANLGSFASVLQDLSGASLNGGVWRGGGFGSASFTGNAFVGTTTVQVAEAGGGTTPAFALFGSASSVQGTPIETGTQLYIVQVPEPTTFALLGLGASAMLIFRRRK